MADVVILLSNEADRAQVQPCYDRLHGLGVAVSLRLASAHVSPAIVQEAVGEAEDQGAKVFICADQGAAHLAGAVAAQSVRPVIGLPLTSGALGGVDALYSTVNMPAGVPVATVGIGGAENAALLAAQILALSNDQLNEQLMDQRERASNALIASDDALQGQLKSNPAVSSEEPASAATTDDVVETAAGAE